MAPPRRGRDPEFPPALKRLGQHFLTDPRILERIAEAVALDGTETVVEIGAGRGSLTEQLSRRAGRVVAMEFDRALAALLRERFASDPTVRIIEGDALKTPLAAAAGDTRFAVAGNVPYYITTPLIFHALAPPRPSRAVFLVQREVAERLVATPTAGDYGALSVNVQALADVEIVFRVAPGAFQPPPKVESAVVRITPRPAPLVAPEEEEPFRLLVQAAFGLRRKQMRRVVRTIRGLAADEAVHALGTAGVAGDARPETLRPEEFAALLRALGPSRAPSRD
jgi:16S rRNA (adenine1518-N6/adenine1519-N6)-dimethyltransferase